MEIITSFFSNFSWWYLLSCFQGVVLGTLVGVLPGLGPMAALSILLPFSYSFMDPTSAIIFLAGVYYGTQYGGSTTSILLNLPGESSSVVTTIEGYQMTKKGFAGKALAISAIGSFIAGTISTLLILLMTGPMAQLSFLFGPVEYSVLMFIGLISCATLSRSGILKSLSVICIGILLGSIGVDVNSGLERFTFGIPELYDGISFAIVAMALFGLTEIVYNILHSEKNKVIVPKFNDLYPSKSDLKKSAPAIFRGTAVGSILGILPGTGSVISSFASYSLEKNLDKNKGEFGNGDIRGVAGPESANNAAAQTSFIPALSLGLPGTPVMALILSALIMHGIQPGPQMLVENQSLFYGLIISMWIGNLFLLILNLPLIGIWVSVLRLPWKFLYPAVFLICLIGAYYISNSWFNVYLMIPFLILGYILKILDFDPAPLAIGFVIGPLFEEYFRRSLEISNGNWFIFLEKPISLAMLIVFSAVAISLFYFKKTNK
jgi:putative tricarboxylic transport membrane protein